MERAKAIRYKTSGVTNTWLEDDEISDDLKVKTEAQFRLRTPKFWIFRSNSVAYTASMTIQSSEMHDDVYFTQIKGLVKECLRNTEKHDLLLPRQQV